MTESGKLIHLMYVHVLRAPFIPDFPAEYRLSQCECTKGIHGMRTSISLGEFQEAEKCHEYYVSETISNKLHPNNSL